MTERKYQSAAQHLSRLQLQLRSGFTKHQLLDEQYWDAGRGARWLIGQPGTSVFRAEIIAGTCGSLLVHGDIDLCRYGHYGDHADAWSRLCWMGKCQDVGYYVAQKANIGMCRMHSRELEYDSDVACYDLERLVKEYRAAPDTDPKLIQLLIDAKVHTESDYELWQFIHEGDQWDLYEHRIGKIVPCHVVVTHEALKRTVQLLEQKHGAEGPPQCRQERKSA